MIPFACLGFLGDQYYLAGLKNPQIKYFQTAKKLFPFDLTILQGEAEAYIIYEVISPQAYDVIKEATSYDPYSVRYLSFVTQYAFALNDNFIGYITFSKLKALYGNTRTVKELIKIVKL